MPRTLYQREVSTDSAERLLVNRLNTTMEAIEIGDGDTFDRSIELVEMLLKTLRKNIYTEIVAYKNELLKASKELMQQAKKQASMSRNEIQRRAFMEGAIAGVMWDYRNDYLEKIISVLGKNQMIPTESGEPATLEQEEIEEEYDEEDEEEIEEEPETIEKPAPKPKPKQQKQQGRKPRLSINRKQEDFEL